MLQEQNSELISWWNDQSFAGKDLFKLEENGDIILTANNAVKERVIATVSNENKDEVVKNLIDSFNAVESRVRETEVEWLAASDKMKMADKVAHLKEYLQHAAALGDFLKASLLVHSWEHTIYQLTEDIHAAKLKLVEQAEGLANSGQWKETTQAFKEISDKWKQAGNLDKGRNDKLWSRVEAARKEFNDRKRLHHEDEEKVMLVNLDLKMDLVEQAESIASSDEWKKTTETYNRLTEEWKKIGHTLHKKNEELWQRFMAAKNTFFERKREHSSKIQVEQEHNYAVKLALVEKAEALKESRDWNKASQAYVGMMDEWKKTGRVNNEQGDELWKRFTEAQDYFFQAKKQHFGSVKEEQENNYNLKKAIYERAERIKNSSNWTDTTNEMISLMDEWKKIGPIPRSYGDQMWEDFNAARKHFFNRKDENRDQRKKQYEEHKVQRAIQARGLVGKLEQEIKEEEEKVAEFTANMATIAPGKKAADLKKLLETLVAEGQENIKKLHKELEQAKNDIKNQDAAAAADEAVG